VQAGRREGLVEMRGTPHISAGSISELASR
jgi:hypothetical protein